MPGSDNPHLRRAGVDPVLQVENLVKRYQTGRGQAVHAVSDVSFDLLRGETLGLVGESGCGKTTIGRAILQLPPPTSGRVVFEGHDLCALDPQALRAIRPNLQIVFQDPFASLNPRRSVHEIVAAPLTVSRSLPARERAARVRATLEAVGLDADAVWQRRPHELSGGQCQRVSLARALILRPKLIVCDEPVSSLDVSVQAQILNLLEDAKQRFQLTMLFIAHDLAVVKNISDRIAVMYLGKLCEIGPAGDLHRAPQHPYTAALIAAIPEPDPKSRHRPRLTISGELPSPLNPPAGCRFHGRCPRAQARCAAEEPQMREAAPLHYVACHFPLAEPAA